MRGRERKKEGRKAHECVRKASEDDVAGTKESESLQAWGSAMIAAWASMLAGYTAACFNPVLAG